MNVYNVVIALGMIACLYTMTTRILRQSGFVLCIMERELALKRGMLELSWQSKEAHE